MNNVLLITLVVGAIVIAVFVLTNNDSLFNTSPLPPHANNERTSILSFTWDFEEASTQNPDGQPQTNVYLSATFENNTYERKLVDTVDGRCSELPGKYEGDATQPGKVQCYSAGLGQQYRIVALKDAYTIERKLFEEALPDSQPSGYAWEPLARFSLIK